MNSVEEALNAPASELINAASNPATTAPRKPAGNMCLTISGNAACDSAATATPFASTSGASSATLPLLANAKQMMPGMIKMNTGKQFQKRGENAAAAGLRFIRRPSARCTMY